MFIKKVQWIYLNFSGCEIKFRYPQENSQSVEDVSLNTVLHIYIIYLVLKLSFFDELF